MSKRGSLESLLEKAKNREKEYAWLESAELYEQALRVVGENDFLEKGKTQERTGYCLYRVAFQAESQEEFAERMQQAVEAYEKAHGFYEKLEDEQKTARMFRCDAVAKYLCYWLTSDPSEKRRPLDECLELEKHALTAFWDLGNKLEYGKTYHELSNVFWLRCFLEWDRQAVSRILVGGVQFGEKSVAALSELGDSYEIAKAYLALAPCLIFFEACFVADPEKKEQYRVRVIEQLRKAVEFSEEVGDAYVVGLSHFWLGFNTAGEESVKHYEKALECGNETRDNFLKALGLDSLAHSTYWKAFATENPDQRRKLAEDAMEFYDKAQHHYSIISYRSPRPGLIALPGGYAEHYLQLAEWETDPEKKLEFLQKSEKAGNEALKIAEDSDLHSIIRTMHHILSKTLVARARVEQDLDKKRSLLKKALKNRKRSTEILEQWNPFNYWDLGVTYNYLAEIKTQLGYLEPDVKDKKRLLVEAVSNKEKCLKLIDKMIPYLEKMGDVQVFGALYMYQDSFGTLLNRLYELTRNHENLRKAIEISQEAVESAKKANMISLMAGSYWKIARAQDVLGEHSKAAESFQHASESYVKAAEKIPQLKDFYQDHASYMEAWSEIEKARHHHRRQEYGSAKEHFAKAANLHKSSRQWSYLAPNYSAWALIEYAEELSRKEQSEESLQTFEQAAQLFKETKKSLQTQRSEIESPDEKQMVTNMLKATNLRHQYCLARIALEEAKILDKKGDHTASSEKYGSAAETFGKISQALESERDLKEFKFLISLSQAWQKMTLAEAEASPALYVEASQHFEEAKDLSPNEKAKMLMLGHSRFCKALEAGTRFEDTRDTTMYSAAKKHMEAAANYYLKAGFKNASEYARGTHRLFDAYMYAHKAETETDPRKKAQFYQMAEKLLQTSAGSYMKAKHPEKSEEVKSLLESVREERQLAMSLIEVLHAPAITSTTTSFSTPTPTHEQAVGLERFEHADIQANLILRVKEVKVGEDIDLEIELINAGKAPALLIKVEKVIPEGFEIKRAPEIYRVEDRFLNMKGKRLNPLKTEEIRIVIKSLSKGTFIIKPRIRYLDENGKYKSHEPEPVTITVKELGIKGWIKGER